MARSTTRTLPLLLIACIGCDGGFTEVDGGDAVVAWPDASTQSCVAAAGSVEDDRPCGCNADCSAGAVCVTEAMGGTPGGQCFRACDQAAPLCNGGTECTDIGAGPASGLCQLPCSRDEDCGNDTGSCGPSGVCSFFCQADADCGSGYCDRYLTQCADGPRSDGADSLARCLRDSECASGFCPSTLGRCVSNCSVRRQGCPAGQACVEVTPGIDIGICFPRCTSQADCSELELDCVNVTRPEGTTVCGPSA